MSTHGPSSTSDRPRLLRAALAHVFSFPAMLGCLLLALALLTVRGRFSDPDMWWHLKTGEIIWRTHAIPHVDLFSYTTHRHAYVPHEWLSQALLYGLWHAGGYTALMLWLWVSVAFVLVAGFALCATTARDALLGFLGAMVIWFFGTIGFALRPHVLGYGLLLVELLLLHLGRTRDRRWFYALPPLFAVWVCCHGSFMFGLVVLTVTTAASFLERSLGPLQPRPWRPETRRTLLVCAALCVAALFLNPAGVSAVFYPLNTLLHQPLGLSNSEEWRPVVWTDSRTAGLVFVVACIYLLPLLRRVPLYADEFAIVSLAAWQAATHRRLLFAFGIVAAPVLCRIVRELYGESQSGEQHPFANATLMTAALATLVVAFPARANLERQVHDGNPVNALAYIHEHHLPGPILNEYVFGGYLIWAAPDYPVFVDGRADVFEWTGVLDSFGKWALRQSDPEGLPDRYGVNLCLLARTSAMAGVLAHEPGWKMVYADDRAVVLTRTPTLRAASEPSPAH